MTRRRTNTQPSISPHKLSQIAHWALAVGVGEFMPCMSDLLRHSSLFVSALRLLAWRAPRVRPGPIPEFRCGCRQQRMHHHRGQFIIGSERMRMVGIETTQSNDIKGSMIRNNSIRAAICRRVSDASRSAPT
jgi:hypothetical protein